MWEKSLKIRLSASWIQRIYAVLCIIFFSTLWRAWIRFRCYGIDFPIWYWFGIFVLGSPLMLQFLDQESSWTEKAQIFNNAIFKRSLWIVILFGITHMGVDVLSIAIWAFIVFWLIFGLNGRFSFWLALWMLIFAAFNLLCKELVYAENFSIYLYYFLCIGVLFELVDGKIAHWLGSDFLSPFWCIKLKKHQKLIQNLDYLVWVGVFIVLIVLALVNILKGIYWDNGVSFVVLVLGMLVMLMVLRGKEYLSDIAKRSWRLAVGTTIGFVLLVRISFYLPMMTVGILPWIFALTSLGALLVSYILGDKRGILSFYFNFWSEEDER